jgi:hypothetical protein
MSYKISPTLENEDLQAVNSICAIKNITERRALQLAIEITSYLVDKESEGYTLVLQKDEDVQEFVLPK